MTELHDNEPQSERSSVEVVEGIGPKASEALSKAGLVTIADLMRVPHTAIHAAVRRLASPEEAKSWRMMAFLIQVREVTGQYAEALYQAGVKSIDQLSQQSISSLTTLFADARQDGLIPDEPDVDQMAQMLCDATELNLTGHCSGVVRSADGQPIEKANVRIGSRRTNTDQQGRFRLNRIPLGWKQTLTVSHPEYRAFIDLQPRIAVNNDLVGEIAVSLDKASSADDSDDDELRELDGDRLPPLTSMNIRVETIDIDQVSEGDIFMVHRFHRSSPSARLVSKFRIFREGEFVVQAVKVPLADLGEGVSEGDHFKFFDSAFHPAKMSANRFEIQLATRRFLKENPELRRPRTIEEIRNFLDNNPVIKGRVRIVKGGKR